MRWCCIGLVFAVITGAGTRKNAADLARNGFAVATVNYRGTHESEGTTRTTPRASSCQR